MLFQEEMRFIRSAAYSSKIKKGRHFSDFLADKIVQAGTERTLLAFNERLMRLMDSEPQEIPSSVFLEGVKAATDANSQDILQWLRGYPKVAAMLPLLKGEDFNETVASIEVTTTDSSGIAIKDAPHDIDIQIKCISPLAHGADVKAGNATIFRRMQVLSNTGGVLSLPFYSGNAFRGIMRDLLADDFVQALGLKPRKDKPPLALWFFHAIYAGGSLSDKSDAEKVLKKLLGGAGAVKAQGIYTFRNTLPALSLLGCALGNRVLNGRVKFADFRPLCKQWDNGHINVSELFDWVYLTRREDHEEHEDHSGMVANTEVLKSGVSLCGGIDTDKHIMPLELSALGRGIELMQEKGYIGAENRRGIGRVNITAENAPDPGPYKKYLVEEKKQITNFLVELEAINAPDGFISEAPVIAKQGKQALF